MIQINELQSGRPPSALHEIASSEKKMLKRLLVILLLLVIPSALHFPAAADDQAAGPQIQEEIWALPFPLPVLAFLVRPVGDGPFPLVVMNHGISLDANQRTMFPMIEYRDAARWFARRGFVVISPIRP